MENTPNNTNKEKTEGIAKLFLPYERGYGEKIKRIAKKHGIEVIFTKDKLWNKNSQHQEERNQKSKELSIARDVKVKGAKWNILEKQ